MQSGALNPLTQSLAADGASLNRLKYQAGQATPAAVKETAKQFESLFMRELLKSMRDATASMKSGMMDSPGGDGRRPVDQQLAVRCPGRSAVSESLRASSAANRLGATRQSPNSPGPPAGAGP
jgi:flagellar protein FlgJ